MFLAVAIHRLQTMEIRSLRCYTLIIILTVTTLSSSINSSKGSVEGNLLRAPPRHYVLVHGSGHGAWCWYKVQTLLQESGHKVTALDLTSGGLDPTDANTLLAFEDYNKPLIRFLYSLPQNEKVVLVGHSAAGLSLTHAIHLFGTSKISAAVFAAAIMLRSGFVTPKDFEMGLPDLSQQVNLAFGKGSDGSPIITSFAFRPDNVRQLLYNESPEEDIVLSLSLIKPAPLHAMQSARFNSTKDVDRVPRVYVKTRQDRVFTQEHQDAMIRSWPPSEVVSIESDHCLFFSAPRRLVSDVLLRI